MIVNKDAEVCSCNTSNIWFWKKISEISHGIGNISYSNGQQKESFGKYQTQIP